MDYRQVKESADLVNQFEKRQRAWKPNMHIQEDVSRYRVDGYLTGEYVPPSETNEHEMECFNLRNWQLAVHDDDSEC
jgi:hypothetical protein